MIVAGSYAADNTHAFVGKNVDFHLVAHGHRIGGFYPLKPELPFDFALQALPIVGFYQIPTARRFNDDAFQNFNIFASKLYYFFVFNIL